MNFNLWFLIVGVLLVAMALSSSLLKRLPLSSSLLYLLVGFTLGPAGYGLIRADAVEQSRLLERITEIAVIISLFTAGLKLSPSLREPIWHIPLRLAFVSMGLTVGLIAVFGVYGLGLSVGAAVLLGAILAPTDPVLASDVQVEKPGDRERLRFSLTGEAGLNDGSAFPFVMLGLGLMGLHEIGTGGSRWLAVDVVWAIAGGLTIGAGLGTLIGRLVLHLRREHREAVGLDDFLALGLIALAYGIALLLSTYGFLAVFAAGLALRRIERKSGGDAAESAPENVALSAGAAEDEEIATHPETAPAYMTRAVLGFTEQLERIGEVAVMVIVGGLLTSRMLAADAAWFVALLFLVIRPAAVWLGLLGSRTSRMQRNLMGWFGIRGIGSIYYLMFAIEHGVPEPIARRLTALTLTVVAVSVVVHGISVTPLMNRYGRERARNTGSGKGLPEPDMDNKEMG